MDQITESYVTDFASKEGLDRLKQYEKFEVFSAFCCILPFVDEIEDVTALHLPGDDFEIDSIGIIINGRVVEDPKEVAEIRRYTK